MADAPTKHKDKRSRPVAKIADARAREIFNLKGFPTVEVDVILEDGSVGRASSPGGTSRGRYEAVDLLDGDEKYFHGMGVFKAIDKVNTEVANAIRGVNVFNQEEVDRLLIELDGTQDKSRLGGNTVIATSLANAKAAARSLGVELYEYFGDGWEVPLSFVYVMFGGPAYVGLKGVGDFQEYALLPLFADSYREGYIATLEIYDRLCALLAQKTGCEKPSYKKMAGIPVPQFSTNEEALAELTRLIEEGGYTPRKDYGIYLDVAATQLHAEGSYCLKADGKTLSTDGMVDWLEYLCDRYPIISIEDGLFEEDWHGWKQFTRRLGNRVQLVGDDLFTTNMLRLKRGIELQAANAIVIKPNQVGTLTETMDTISLAKEAGYGTVISPRSGELWDPYLVHLCVAQRLGQGKITGAFVTGESNVNEISRISDSLGDRIEYAGKNVLARFL